MTNYEVLEQLSYYSTERAVIDNVTTQLETTITEPSIDDITSRINSMSKWELLDAYLNEEGIIGYTDKIVDLFLSLYEADNTPTKFRYSDTDSTLNITLKEN